MLKPLKLDEVSSRLEGFRTTLEKMRHIVEQTSELEKKISGSLKLVKERFVTDLIWEIAITDELLASWQSLVELPDRLRGLQLFIFGLDRFQTSGKDAKERMLLGSGFRQTVDVGLPELDSIFVAQTSTDEILAIHLDPTPEEQARVEKQLVFIQSMMQEQHGLTVTIGCSQVGQQWQDAATFYKEVKFMMAQARLIADGQIVRHDHMNAHEFKDYRLREEYMPTIVKLMEAGEAAKVSEYMNRILELLLSQEPFSFPMPRHLE